jgi:hypothetical protein
MGTLRLTVDAGDDDAAHLVTAVGQVLGTRLVRDGDGDSRAMTVDELATWLARAPAAA